jgi:hypothetical protein
MLQREDPESFGHRVAGEVVVFFHRIDFRLRIPFVEVAIMQP